MAFHFDKADRVVRAPLAAAYTVLHSVTVRLAETSPNYVFIRKQLAEDDARQTYTLDEFRQWGELVDLTEAAERHYSPAPRVEAWLRSASVSHPVSAAVNETMWAWQRVTRGWDDRSTWSLDRNLCKVLGQQLIHLANTTHGWPQSHEYPEFEDWTDALRHHGEVLTLAAEWNDDVDLVREDQRLRDATVSLYWVADNLPALWD